MDERDYKAMNDELKKEQPSIELQISDEQLDKIKSCEVLKINGMEFISRAKTTEMLIKFANEQLKEKDEEIERLKSSLFTSERFRIEDASESIDDKNILHARLMDCKSQLTKSNEMNERLAVEFADWMHDKDFINGVWHYSNESGDIITGTTQELLTEFKLKNK